MQQSFTAALKKAGKQLELVLVSSDRNEQAFEEYHACMPWPAIAFACPERKAKLAERYGVSIFPFLLLPQASLLPLQVQLHAATVTFTPK
jgi:nucleoredoxin